MSISKGVVLVHKGALGDFLQVWPSLVAVRRHFPDLPLYWAGREIYSLWTKPLGIRPCPGWLQQAVDWLPAAQSWPSGLQGYNVLWFGLKRPPTSVQFPDMLFVPGIREGDLTPPRQVYAAELHHAGIEPAENWLGLWRELCGRAQPLASRVLLWPGAGHRAKCWPLPRFQGLAENLQAQGWEPVFVCGPAELERGLRVQKFQLIAPEDLAQLQAELGTARFVLGNDSGPMHLAGMLGCTGLALFGPASAKQWGPIDLCTLQAHVPCSPCTQVGRIHCSQPECMQSISQATVWGYIQSMLGE